MDLLSVLKKKKRHKKEVRNTTVAMNIILSQDAVEGLLFSTVLCRLLLSYNSLVTPSPLTRRALTSLGPTMM